MHRRAARRVGRLRLPAGEPVGRADRRGGHLGDLAQLQLAGRRRVDSTNRARRPWPPTSPPTPGPSGRCRSSTPDDSASPGATPRRRWPRSRTPAASTPSPTPVDVASALAYATQLPNGTHELDFNGLGPHVYNPSTYSYLLTPTTGWSPSKGATMSAWVNYALTLGQQKAPSVRVRQSRAVTRAVRHQRRTAQRAGRGGGHLGREGGLRVR